MACRLLCYAADVWLELQDGAPEGTCVEQILPRLQAIMQFVDEVRGRISPDGIDGIDAVLGRYRQLKDTLGAIADAEIDRVAAQVAALQRALADVERDVETIRQLKRALGA
jgi:hypothetical protein